MNLDGRGAASVMVELAPWSDESRFPCSFCVPPVDTRKATLLGGHLFLLGKETVLAVFNTGACARRQSAKFT
ncbi:hypothetical protein D9M68_575360 [compost metagenome]